jgi:hypothetical protein
VLWTLFSTVLLIPKVLTLRRRVQVWNSIRLGAGAIGVAAMAAGVIVKNHHGFILAGILLIVAALVIGPERHKISVDERARELGALVVLDGGQGYTPEGKKFEARLGVGTDRVWVLGTDLRVVREFLLSRLQTLQAVPAGSDWKLCLAGDQLAAEFLYEGVFAEHLARVAEATLRNRVHRELAVIP